MTAIPNARTEGSSWNPYSCIKQGIIGAAAGCLQWLSSVYVLAPICRASTGELSNYLCLRSATFFEPERLAFFLRPIAKLSGWVEKGIERVTPNCFPIQTCNLITQNLGRVVADSTIPMDLRDLILEKSILCCAKVPFYADKIVGDALKEEIVYRVCLQKIMLLAASRLFPKRVGTFLARPASRVLIASSIFALVHRSTSSVLPHFLGGLVIGSLFEKYGLWTSLISHSTVNFCGLVTWKNYCDSTVLTFINSIVSERLSK